MRCTSHPRSNSAANRPTASGPAGVQQDIRPSQATQHLLAAQPAAELDPVSQPEVLDGPRYALTVPGVRFEVGTDVADDLEPHLHAARREQADRLEGVLVALD